MCQIFQTTTYLQMCQMLHVGSFQHLTNSGECEFRVWCALYAPKRYKTATVLACVKCLQMR